MDPHMAPFEGKDRREFSQHVERIVALEVEMETIKSAQKEMLEKQDQILDEMRKYKGFLGGISFVVSGVAVFWSLFGNWVRDHWH